MKPYTMTIRVTKGQAQKMVTDSQMAEVVGQTIWRGLKRNLPPDQGYDIKIIMCNRD